ncbi:MAG: type IX secretion system protein PorD [Bacteroidales bacterium]
MNKVFVVTWFFLFIINSYSQELNCRVSIFSQQIQTTNKHIFESMQKDIYEFMNNRKWTEHVYSYDEKIECSILINLTEQISTDQFKGTMQIQSIRPIFNTNYNSVMLNLKDNDIEFNYQEFQSLEFNENTFSSNLVSLLAYYAYVIIGFDYDSYSLMGGTPYFQKAEKIVQNAQNAQEKGWKSFESQKNRYWLIENLLNSKYAPIREFNYKYHRLGLDIMSEKQAEGRAQIADALQLVQKVYRSKPSPFMMLLQILFDAKSDEFVQIFSESFPDEKARIVNILKEVDPTNSNKYQRILTENKQ